MSVLTRIRAYPRAAATGVAVAVFLAGGNAAAPLHDGQRHYRAGIIAHPRFEASISFDDDGWAARAVPTASAIGWAPAEAASLDELSALYWRDAAIEIDRVVDGVVSRRLTGTIAEATVSEGKLIITCADLARALDKPFTTATFAGTGGIEGGDFAIGRAKRRSFGLVWNVEGRLLDKANNIYEFGDPAFPLQGCSAVRDMGRAGPLGIIAWQGSIAATLDALRAGTPQRGGGLFAPSIACGKWWTQPAGPLTADLQGEAAGYSQTPAGVAAQLLAAAGGPAITDNGLLRTAWVGIHVGDNNETTAAALDRLLQRIAMGWRLNSAGTVELWDYRFTAPVESLRATFISRESTIQPVKSRQVGYRKNERIHGDGEISAAVQATDVVYEDGTTAEDWKPADQGATKGAPGSTPFGDGSADKAMNALKALALTTDPDTIVAGAQALIDRSRKSNLAALEQQLLGQERKARWERLLHLDGVEISTRVQQEIKERVDGDVAIVAMVNAIEAASTDGISAALAAIEQEATVRASADAAETFARELAISLFRTEVDGEIADVMAAVASESETRANADGAEAAARLALAASMAGEFGLVNSAILNEQIARVAADQAEAVARAALAVTLNNGLADVAAMVASEETARVTADGALAADISGLSAAFGGMEASIDVVAAAQASADSAIALLSTTLEARTSARWEVETVSGDNRARLRIFADANQGAGVAIVGDVQIDGSLLVTKSVSAEQIVAEGITRTRTLLNGSVANLSASLADIVTIAIDMDRPGTIIVLASYQFTFTSATWSAAITVGGVDLQTGSGSVDHYASFIGSFDVTTAGTYTARARASGAGASINAGGCSLIVIRTYA